MYSPLVTLFPLNFYFYFYDDKDKNKNKTTESKEKEKEINHCSIIITHYCCIKCFINFSK